MANFGTFVMRPKEDTARDKLIPRKLVRQSRGDTKDEDVICHHSAHCRQILSIKTPLSSPSNSRIIWHVAAVACVCVKRMRFVYVCVTSDRTISNMATWPLRPRHDVNLLRGGAECTHPLRDLRMRSPPNHSIQRPDPSKNRFRPAQTGIPTDGIHYLVRAPLHPRSLRMGGVG